HFVESMANVIAPAEARQRVEESLREHIRERQRYEHALRRSEESYHALAERLPDGIAVFRGGCFIYVNPAFLHQHGIAGAEDVIGQPIGLLLPDEERAVAQQLEPGAIDEPRPAIPREVRRRDGSRLAVEISLFSTVFDGAPACLAVIQDV